MTSPSFGYVESYSQLKGQQMISGECKPITWCFFPLPSVCFISQNWGALECMWRRWPNFPSSDWTLKPFSDQTLLCSTLCLTFHGWSSTFDLNIPLLPSLSPLTWLSTGGLAEIQCRSYYWLALCLIFSPCSKASVPVTVRCRSRPVGEESETPQGKRNWFHSPACFQWDFHVN